jgi:hypothetical protein
MTHELIATIAARDPRDDVATLLAEISSLAPALACRQSGLGSRTRAATLVAMTSAATYVRRFLPPPTCRLIGTEMPVEGGRVDLVWGTGADGIIYDEVKLASGAGSHMVDGAALQQVLRYATAGRARHGDAFLGVRLLLLGAPRSSLFFDPAGRQQLLSGTRFQFDIPVEVTR